MEIVKYSEHHHANLLLNCGPKGSEELVADEIEIYQEVGRRRRAFTV